MALDLVHENDEIEGFEVNEEQQTSLTIHHDQTESSKFNEIAAHCINQIHNNAALITEYLHHYQSSSCRDDRRKIIHKIDMILTKNSALTMHIKQTLSTEKERLLHDQHVLNMQSQPVVEYNRTVQQYQSALISCWASLNSFHSYIRKKQMRQIRTLRTSADIHIDIEAIRDLNYEQRQQWIQEQYELTNDPKLQRLVDSNKQRDGMVKIEQSLSELKALFHEMNVLLTEQDLVISGIANETNRTKKDVENTNRRWWVCTCYGCACLLVLFSVSALLFCFAACPYF